ncbi:hypothetical protein K432DRAFT_438546 [Lepidopterella palustris CBS 459.81]|uniref:UBA domain-containing protein n=1 Tax=Lepidopterella palustris CBS 459.81 TaxID=1314670 RepID=A0A8E2JL28_9PEZI|nr:hypothetical protein K432DRAFT_438546 [Lepidopterella palustris CBS 459.81]
MGRVILDSDDECMSGSCSPVSMQVEGLLPAVSTAEVALGTSSTEVLKRNLEAAHRDFVGSATRFEMGGGDDIDFVSPMRSNKRRKTTNDINFSQSFSKKLERRKSEKTYGQAGRRKRFEDNCAFDALAVLEDHVSTSARTQLSERISEEPLEQITADEFNVTEETGSKSPWKLPGSIRDEFVQHEPLAMFPSLSSTVPNNTLTQQRLLEMTLAPTSLNVDPDPMMLLPDPEHQQSSIPWSTFLTTPSVHKGSPKNSAETAASPEHHSNGLGKSSINGSCDILDTSLGTPKATSALCSQPKLSPITPAKSLRRFEHSRATSEAIELPGSQGLSSDELAPIAGHSLIATKQGGVLKKARQHKRREMDFDIDELSCEASGIVLPEERHQSQPGQSRSERGHDENYTNTQTKRTNIKQATASQSLESDDIAVDFPKENYKPRPSRSRSTRIIEDEPIDYSIRPERAARVRAKRSNTVGGSIGRLVPSSSEKIVRICAMGFSSSQARHALEANGGDLELAGNWLLNNITPASQDIASDAITVPKQDEHAIEKGDEHNLANEGSCRNSPESEEAVIDQTNLAAESAKPSHTDKSYQLLQEEIPVVSDSTVKTAEILTKMFIEDDGNAKSTESPKITSPDPAMPTITQTKVSQVVNKQCGQFKDADPPVPKSKRRRTTHFEGLVETADVELELSSEAPKKRGRGRPRLRPKTPEEIVDVHNDEEEIPDAQPELDAHGSALLEVKSNAKQPDIQPFKANGVSTVSGQEQCPPNTLLELGKKISSSPENTTVSNQSMMHTPQKPRTAPIPVHSPINKSKVPLRVGLSKRAKIAPLLRIVKK